MLKLVYVLLIIDTQNCTLNLNPRACDYTLMHDKIIDHILGKGMQIEIYL